MIAPKAFVYKAQTMSPHRVQFWDSVGQLCKRTEKLYGKRKR
jgi:hypothetical protein